MSPVSEYTSKQSYLPSSNILQTIFNLPDGSVFEIIDFMPISPEGRESIVRIVTLLEGDSLDVSFECSPKFSYARLLPKVKAGHPCEVSFISSQGNLRLRWDSILKWSERNSELSGTFRVHREEKLSFILEFSETPENEIGFRVPALILFQKTKEFWENWSRTVPVIEDFQAPLLRSALALKLLTHNPTGSVIAAPTTSLPEEIGGTRNWDYRYVWLRDATFVVDAFYQIGHPEEGRAFTKWVRDKAKVGVGPLQIAYTIKGGKDAPEIILEHLCGYEGSVPVRIGNAAFEQIQLDVYGEIINCIYLCGVHQDESALKLWKKIEHLIHWVCDHWSEPDYGIWEVRGVPKHFVHSKVMAWVALDRAILKSAELGMTDEVLTKWKHNRDSIRSEVLSRGWNEELQSFVQAYDSKELDAANLRMSLVGFLPADHPKMKGTMNAVKKHLTENGLVFRYKNTNEDGVEGSEASFAICTFWLVQNLILVGELEEAESLLKNILAMGSETGLFSEEIDPKTGRLLGNFPQSFTHVGIINSIVLLDRARKGLDLGSIGHCHFIP